MAYGATALDYMSSEATHVVSTAVWGDAFEEAAKENPALVFVKPSWIAECVTKGTMVPTTWHEIN